MKARFSGALLAGGWMAAIAGAYPVEGLDRPPQTRTVHLTFRGATSSYSMAFPADNTIHPTKNDLSVSVIEAPDYPVFTQCKVYTRGAKDVTGSVTEDGLQLVSIGPPQPILGVSCYGACVATWGACEGEHGQILGSCCNGYCAAKLCLPWGNLSA